MRSIENTEGQSTVEFALVGIAFMAMAIAFGVLWRALESGLFVDHALLSASHHLVGVSIGVVGDVFLY